ncbi:uncharacterized protein LOC108735248 [Agrilus planipennis]|uniref:Uncharacterized protein LOC108735248 n=1 Tax=Agrilus planipennis TaxID=224129 RepID=A0A1W4WF82_AGRPL|nr:uncharacterized protein LOC108735248 [Agrilus planipennis]
MNGIKNANLIFPTESGYYNVNSGGAYESVSIEVGLASELQTFPNQRPKIYFEVTNNRTQSILLLFKCEDTKGILFTTWPLKAWLGAGEKTVVTVTLWARGSVDMDYQDQVTLHAISVSSKWEKSVIVYVNSQKLSEYTQPSITYDLVNDCYKVLVGSCQDATWSAEIVVQDPDSGLLRVTSDPQGVYFPFKYATGTQNLVKGYYSASCCQSRVKIMATDLKMNISTREISAYELKIWVIAVIVISSIVFLALIIGLVVWIVIKKQKVSVDLPVYRGSRTNTSP